MSSNPSTIQADVTKQAAVQTSKDNKQKLVTTPVTHDEQHAPIVLHNDTLAVVGKMFATQTDYENESKFARTFMHTAVLGAAKAECRRIQNVWENAITKLNKLHPTMTREQAEQQLLESKRNKEIKAQVDIATSLLKDEFKS